MANKIMKFISEKFGNHRGIYLDGQPWLYAKEVCATLKLNDVYQAVNRLDDDEKRHTKSNSPKTYNISPRGGRSSWLINEPGFYSLVLTSRTPEAKKFKYWVCHEVLPAIRRTGEYRETWQDARDGGKVTRRNLTDTIKAFCEYLEQRGELDRPPGTWIIIFSKRVNKAVGVGESRNDLSAKQLFELDTCEHICTKTIIEGMAAEKGHHDVWLTCDEKLGTWQQLIK